MDRPALASQVLLHHDLPCSSMTLTVARHGDCTRLTTGGWSDNSLTDLGRSQVAFLASRLGRNHDLIVSSDLLRARQSAQILSDALGCPVVLDPAFREFNNGIFCNMKIEDYLSDPRRRFYSELAWDESCLGGDSPSSFYSRIYEALCKLIGSSDGKKILLVTHGGVINILLCILHGYRYTSSISFGYPYASAFSAKFREGCIEAVEDL